MSTDLDSRLRSASTSLRASVAGLEPRPLPARGPARHPLLTAAAVVVVVATVVAVAAALRDDETGVSTDPDRVPRLVLDESLVGIPATGAVELPVDAADGLGAPARVTVYEAPVGEGGVARLGVLTLHVAGDDGASWEPGQDSEPTTVRGEPGWVRRDDAYGTSVAWEVAPEQVVIVASRQLDREQLLAAVEAGTDDDGRVAPGPVAPGLDAPEPLGRPVDVDLFALAPVPAGAVGHGVGYQSDDDVNRVAFLSVVAGDADDVTALRWMSEADTPVDVRGHAGWLGTRTFPEGGSSDEGSAEGGDSDGGVGGSAGDGDDDASGSADSGATVESHTLIWEERPGVVVVLSASGFDVGEFQELADAGIREVSDDEWAALAESTDSPTPPGAEAAVASSDGDVEWSVYLDDGVVCASVETGSSASETCGSAPGGAEVLSDDDGNELAVYGAFPEGAVAVQAPDGSPLGASTAPAEDGVTVYAITLDEGPPPTEVVFVDADGNEVGRIQVGFAPAVEAESPTAVDEP